MKIKEGGGMDIQKEREAYLGELLEREVITQDEFRDLVFKPEINAFDSNYLSSRFIDKINFGWSAWQAKAQAVPEQIAEKMAIDRIDKPRHENDPVWSEIAEQSYKDQVKSKKWEFWRDYKTMIEAQEPAKIEKLTGANA